MRVALLVAASTILVCASAAAQTDEISLYSDPGYNNCELVDRGSGVATIYVVHHTVSGATASQFMVRGSPDADLVLLGFNSEYLKLGDPESGLAVAYQGCLNSDVRIGTITYLMSGTSGNCSYLQIVPDPSSHTGTIEVQDCNDYKLEASGTRLVINPDGSCACGPTTEITNWGRIKDRFRD